MKLYPKKVSIFPTNKFFFLPIIIIFIIFPSFSTISKFSYNFPQFSIILCRTKAHNYITYHIRKMNCNLFLLPTINDHFNCNSIPFRICEYHYGTFPMNISPHTTHHHPQIFKYLHLLCLCLCLVQTLRYFIINHVLCFLNTCNIVLQQFIAILASTHIRVVRWNANLRTQIINALANVLYA